MAGTLKPCPLCGSTDVKHYVTNARERNRGVIVCKNCGLRLEAYSDDEYKVAQAYQGDFESAHEFTWEQARRAVADKWNRRAVRTCRVVSSREDECDQPVAWFEFELSCGHSVCHEGQLPPSYCPECGARVVA